MTGGLIWFRYLRADMHWTMIALACEEIQPTGPLVKFVISLYETNFSLRERFTLLEDEV